MYTFYFFRDRFLKEFFNINLKLWRYNNEKIHGQKFYS